MARELDVIDARTLELATAGTGDRIRGIEGDVARRYFKAMAIHLAYHGVDFEMAGRTRRPPRDPVNCLLSFLYGVFLTEIIGACEAVGLDPQVGFLHRPRSGRPSLALDLLEEFRPSLIDRLAVAMLTRRQVRLDHFERIGDAWYLSDVGRSAVLSIYDEHRSAEVSHPLLRLPVAVWQLPFVQATLMARHIRGEFPVYPAYVPNR
ncbi:MAG: hypothetical protein KatS3mg008_1963 [Acidimicrobiales bacterium]|nr:MAG: hypothetical protein KatS3mg008_1963 [Acidimicrobiales bacterium]